MSALDGLAPRRRAGPSRRIRWRLSTRPGRPTSHGQAVVEFALIAPIMVLVLLAAVDFGRIMFSWIEVTNAAREAAAYAVYNPTDSVGIQTRAEQETNVQAQRGEHPLTITTTCRDSSTQAVTPCNALVLSGLGSQVTVEVKERFTFFSPLIGAIFPNMEMGASATGFSLSTLVGGAPAPPTPPAPTPTPTSLATPTPTPAPTPALCTVPNFVGPPTHNGRDAEGMWTAAGFDRDNLTNNVRNNKPIKGQSLGAGTQQPCETATIILIE
ncbi:MAG TPA: TadE family protein [Candidatus Limnocylindrales bacterium]